MSYSTRFTAIMDALVDGTASNTQKTNMADACVELLSDDEVLAAFGHDRTLLTNAEKAQVVVERFRRVAKSMLRNKAMIDAKVTADSTVSSAGDAAEAGI
jgi:deoxyadenosine/deoxycytidine kinase